MGIRGVMGVPLERLRRHCSLAFHPTLNFFSVASVSPSRADFNAH
jgi:hypothetical protein